MTNLSVAQRARRPVGWRRGGSIKVREDKNTSTHPEVNIGGYVAASYATFMQCQHQSASHFLKVLMPASAISHGESHVSLWSSKTSSCALSPKTHVLQFPLSSTFLTKALFWYLISSYLGWINKKLMMFCRLDLTGVSLRAPGIGPRTWKQQYTV